jgi:putative flippase GtrA
MNLSSLRNLLRSTVFSYLMVASAGAVVDLIVFASLVYLAGVGYIIASIPAFFLATLVNYILSIIFIFQSRTRFSQWKELAIIYLVSGTGLLWHLILLYLFIDILVFHVMFGKILALGFVFFWNYLVRRFYIFSSKVKHDSSLPVPTD